MVEVGVSLHIVLWQFTHNGEQGNRSDFQLSHE